MLKEWGNSKLLVNLSVALLFLLFASVVTWPLLISPDPHDHADTLFNTWLIHWNNFAIFSGNNPVNQPIFEGFQDADGRNDFLLAQSTVAIPFQLLGVNPIRTHNLLLVLSLAFAGYAMFILAGELKVSIWGRLFAGAVTIFLPYFQSHLWHLQLFSIGFSILALLYALRLLEDKSKLKSNGLMLGLFILLQCLSSLYFWYFLNLSLVILIITQVVRKKTKLLPNFLLWWFLGNIISTIFLLNHLASSTQWSVDTITSTDLTAFIAPWQSSYLLSWMRTEFVHPEAALWPGISVITGFIWFFFSKQKENYYKYFFVLIIFFSLFSLGPTLVVFGKPIAPAPFRFFSILPGCSSIRLPARAAIFALIPMILLAGKALGKKPVAAIAGIVLSALTVFHPPVATTRVAIFPYTEWLKEQNIERILYLPISYDIRRPEIETQRMFSSISHFTPSINGYSTTLPEQYVSYADILNSWPSEEAKTLITELNIDCLVLENCEVETSDTIFTDNRVHFSVFLVKNN